MKKFLIRFSGFLSLAALAALLCIGLLFSVADGHTDAHYLRFTSPLQQSMILGNSRAAQGIQPSVLKNILHKDFYNYSFTFNISSFGPVYYRSIARKLDPHTKDGIFIIAIDPWSLASQTEDPNDTANFRETKERLYQLENVSSKPNIEYLATHYNDAFYKILFNQSILNKRIFNAMEVQEDGWLDVDLKLDSLAFEAKVPARRDLYLNEHLPISKFSEARLAYLLKTIELLKKHGEVYLVRVPVHPLFMEVEDMLMPNMDSVIDPAIRASDGFLDLSPYNEKFIFIDGNHLYKDSGAEVSRMIGEWIKGVRSH